MSEIIMRKVILSQGLVYNDEYNPPFNWTYDILVKLIETKSELISYEDEIGHYFDRIFKIINDVSYVIYEDKYDNESYIEYDNKYYYYNWDSNDIIDSRENLELITLLENNPHLCLNSEGELIFKIASVPEDLCFEIKRKNVRINGINSKLIESEFISEIRAYGF